MLPALKTYHPIHLLHALLERIFSMSYEISSKSFLLHLAFMNLNRLWTSLFLVKEVGSLIL